MVENCVLSRVLIPFAHWEVASRNPGHLALVLHFHILQTPPIRKFTSNAYQCWNSDERWGRDEGTSVCNPSQHKRPACQMHAIRSDCPHSELHLKGVNLTNNKSLHVYPKFSSGWWNQLSAGWPYAVLTNTKNSTAVMHLIQYATSAGLTRRLAKNEHTKLAIY